MKSLTKIFAGISTVVLLCISGAIILTTFWFLSTQNNLVSLKEDVEMQKSQIETTLQRRSDLIPNFVATVKGYAAHEEKIYTEIADARYKLTGSIETGNIERMIEANDALNSSISKLLALSENYPELKSSEQFVALQDELAGTENRITVARQYYNEKVKTYNTSVKRFPSSIVAKAKGFSPIQYFEADENSKTVPEINFD